MCFYRISTRIYTILSKIMQFFGLRNVIMLEAEQGTTQNTQRVFNEMLHRSLNKRFRIVLVSSDPKSILDWESKNVAVVKRIQYGDSWASMMRMRWLYFRACMIIDENKQIRKRYTQTVHVFLTHGSPVKDTRGFYSCEDDTDFALCQSEYWRPIVSVGSPVPAERRVILGQPRNDAFFDSQVSMKELIGEQYEKVVVWYPTYRQHKHNCSARGTDSSSLPIIHDEEEARRINEIAAKYGVLLVVKPHPVQDLSLIKAMNLDHLKLIYDDFFVSHGITSYEFLAKTDALITDYSSVVFDYLLSGNPIALAQEDYEEYEKKVGFAIDMNLLRSCAVKLERAEDFEPFFRDLIAGNDPLQKKRDELMHLTNQYVDGNSTMRVVDWLESLLQKP